MLGMMSEQEMLLSVYLAGSVDFLKVGPSKRIIKLARKPSTEISKTGRVNLNQYR